MTISITITIYYHNITTTTMIQCYKLIVNQKAKSRKHELVLCGIYTILTLYAFLVYLKYTLKKALVTKIYILRIVCVLYYFFSSTKTQRHYNPFHCFLLLFMILMIPRSESLLCCVLAQAYVSQRIQLFSLHLVVTLNHSS